MTNSFPLTIVAFIVAIGLLIAVHEYGHFWVARRLGFRVLRFSVGFWKPLWKRVGRDGTEYTIGVLPIGGYVKLLDAREETVPAAQFGESFQGRPVWARILMILAGPAANVVFAVFAFWLLFQIGVPGLKPVVGDVLVESVAARGGLRSGDEILAVDGHAVQTREGTVLGLVSGLVGDGTAALRVRGKDGTERAIDLLVPEAERVAITEPGAWGRGLGFDFLRPVAEPRVMNALPGRPAALAGMQGGDLILSVDGQPVSDFSQVVGLVSARAGQTVDVVVDRAGSRVPLRVAVAAAEEGGRTVGRIGIDNRGARQTWPSDMETLEQYGPLAALGPAVTETWEGAALTVKFLWRMVTGDVSVKNISGPISIAAAAGATAAEGPAYYLKFLAIISLSLAVLNLLPVPMLDGGQVVYQVAELVKGRPLSDRVQALGQQAGIVLLVLLMGLAFYNDLSQRLG